MRILIAAACVAIITFAGYFFWSEDQRRKGEDVRVQEEASLKSWLFALQDVAEGNDAKMKSECSALAYNSDNKLFSAEAQKVADRAISACRRFDYL